MLKCWLADMTICWYDLEPRLVPNSNFPQLCSQRWCDATLICRHADKLIFWYADMLTRWSGTRQGAKLKPITILPSKISFRFSSHNQRCSFTSLSGKLPSKLTSNYLKNYLQNYLRNYLQNYLQNCLQNRLQNHLHSLAANWFHHFLCFFSSCYWTSSKKKRNTESAGPRLLLSCLIILSELHRCTPAQLSPH